MSEQTLDKVWASGYPPASKRFVLESSDGYKVNVNKLLRVDENNIQEAYTTQAAWSHFFLREASEAKLLVERQRRHIAELKGKTYLEYKHEAADSNLKPPVSQLEAAVESDTRVADAHKKLHRLQKNALQWEAVQYAWRDRLQMLIQLGAELRLEKKL